MTAEPLIASSTSAASRPEVSAASAAASAPRFEWSTRYGWSTAWRSRGARLHVGAELGLGLRVDGLVKVKLAVVQKVGLESDQFGRQHHLVCAAGLGPAQQALVQHRPLQLDEACAANADVAVIFDRVDNVAIEERVVLERRVAAVVARAVLGIELVLTAFAVAASRLAEVEGVGVEPQELDERVELADAVLQGRTGKAPAHVRVQPKDGLRGRAAPVLDGMRLVQDHAVPVDAVQRRARRDPRRLLRLFLCPPRPHSQAIAVVSAPCTVIVVRIAAVAAAAPLALARAGAALADRLALLVLALALRRLLDVGLALALVDGALALDSLIQQLHRLLAFGRLPRRRLGVGLLALARRRRPAFMLALGRLKVVFLLVVGVLVARLPPLLGLGLRRRAPGVGTAEPPVVEGQLLVALELLPAVVAVDLLVGLRLAEVVLESRICCQDDFVLGEHIGEGLPLGAVIRVDAQRARRSPLQDLGAPLDQGDDRNDDQRASPYQPITQRRLGNVLWESVGGGRGRLTSRLGGGGRGLLPLAARMGQHHRDGLQGLAHPHLVGQNAPTQQTSLLRTHPREALLLVRQHRREERIGRLARLRP
eukprot:scaffold22513_cov107-Isochrysis_galbana.AAC.4